MNRRYIIFSSRIISCLSKWFFSLYSRSFLVDRLLNNWNSWNRFSRSPNLFI
nr:MAG TPA: hypothetical protein [Caudoviricetes sp.]